MKKLATVFDKYNREEDLALLKNDKSTSSEEKIKMLLGKYNIEIFEPDIQDLNCPGQNEIDMIMEKTKSFRPSNGRRFFSVRYFAYAASFFLVCVLAFSVLRTNYAEKNILGEEPSNSQFRGGTAAAPATSPENKTESEPLAYLVDAQGKIEIVHQGEKKNMPSSCEVLYKGDVLILAEQARANVMYADAFFHVSGPMQYKIEDPDPVTVNQDNAAPQRLEPAITTRGMHLGLNTTKPIIMPPGTLLASAVTPITRAGADGINVFSPKGASFTDKPIIRIGGDPKLTYIVSILDLEGTVIGKSIPMKGNSQREWTDFSQSSMVGDEIYTLRVQQNEKIVNDINNSSFWLVSKAESDTVSIAMKSLSSLKTESERLFFQANAFYMNGCYSEALLLLESIKENEDNRMFAQLKKLCKSKLNISEKGGEK